MKRPVFNERVLELIRELPREVRIEIGKAIFDLQLGIKLKMPLSRPMPIVGKGVEELRLKDRSVILPNFLF